MSQQSSFEIERQEGNDMQEKKRSGPLCPDCKRPTTVLVFLIICGNCELAMTSIEYLLRVRAAKQRETEVIA